MPTLGGAIPPWWHLGKVLIQAQWGGEILLAIGVVDGIFSRTIKPYCTAASPNITCVPIVTYLTQTHPHISHRHTAFPGSQVVCRAENPQAFCQALGKHRESRIQPLPGSWVSLGTQEVTPGAPGTLRVCPPSLRASVSPVGSAAQPRAVAVPGGPRGTEGGRCGCSTA